ncbi:MAG: hypothetical protein JW841_18190 [Deltaproteobacteria bacterium]|nr:hypothetical protein [Deltaproteobacteria bacterium]
MKLRVLVGVLSLSMSVFGLYACQEGEQAAEQPAAEGAAADKPAAEGATADKAAAEGAATDKPAAEGAATDKPAAEGATADKAVAFSPAEPEVSPKVVIEKAIAAAKGKDQEALNALIEGEIAPAKAKKRLVAALAKGTAGEPVVEGDAAMVPLAQGKGKKAKKIEIPLSKTADGWKINAAQFSEKPSKKPGKAAKKGKRKAKK